MSMAHHDTAARRWFGRAYAELHEGEQRVIQRAVERRLLSTDTNAAFAGKLTFGERLADRVAQFGGSWTFIILFALVLVAWVLVNARLLANPFDPYPFIFLNLMLSMLAAVQAPIIMMSQNRQASKDRLDAAHDYEVNLKAEMEIMALHEKLDAMRDAQLADLLRRQEEQLTMIRTIVERLDAR
ncbi:DUF1003 domain-containing protein [Lysobacter sp. TY2-98]|uniref:DUF1003 domain-containing protein n=1 Tax=Lysobacter sp. TY2-98 TaxID=2290922 RepID=UPI000E20BAE6|nr:DUF1003 domain-containing protein [Lysobacter sp. TY2-98]AXK73257.1 DUF1003 domain-containing protein [Lysobacter sp. TY2-98]